MSEKIQIKHYKNNGITRNTSFVDNLEEYVGYWRLNPHRFITEYIGGTLHGFQNEIIYTAQIYNYLCYAASRGLAKSTVGAWFCCMRCILYPNQKIVITAYEKEQSTNFIVKIEEFKNTYPNLANEIEDIKTGKNDSSVKFKNGSTIKAKTASPGARSGRCEILIADEFALFKDKEILSSVFTPFMTNTRSPLYQSLSNEEKLKYHEPNKEIYLSSIRTEMDWSWQYFLQIIDFICNGDDKYIAFALPYHYGVKHGYITPENVAKQFRENPNNIQLIRAEYEAIPIRSDKNSFFQYDFFHKARSSIDVLIAMSDEEFLEYKNKMDKWKYYKEKKTSRDKNSQYEEIRIMSVDVALIGGNTNDNTSINVFRLQPHNNGYKKLLAYSETINGTHSKTQAIRIKQLFYEMNCDYIVIDANGNSISVVDHLMDYTEDSNRGITYEPWTTANPDEVNLNYLAISGIASPVMYAIKTSASDNHIIYNNAKKMLESGEIELPVTDMEAISKFNTLYGYYKINDNDLKQRLINTFAQTNMLVLETINLVTSSTGGGYIKLEPKSGRRKDRFTSWAYGLYLIKNLEDEYKKSLIQQESSFLDYAMFV